MCSVMKPHVNVTQSVGLKPLARSPYPNRQPARHQFPISAEHEDHFRD
ncbi:hypothetical protein SNOG_01181 [Parastagonospora nodorum SN15]|uniref:Uncharacterized protein n=1 Tax=Phaeosphaeria nodorum (strain SN15 / ATCC MYA-4574 / FGSC 10173) TaxID=321614 RepID=Q0V483_PHANO|nr:hypothetical protein SNOG_01181 [Parastagonospora nodorum SN15]EAT90830.1 hypothetical protein SNOG_01181 [Parastagonospora nodorum SN15]